MCHSAIPPEAGHGTSGLPARCKTGDVCTRSIKRIDIHMEEEMGVKASWQINMEVGQCVFANMIFELLGLEGHSCYVMHSARGAEKHMRDKLVKRRKPCTVCLVLVCARPPFAPYIMKDKI